MVGALQDGQRGVRADGGGEGGGGDPAEPVHRDGVDLAAVGLVALGDVQHAGVLDRRVDQVGAAPPVAAQGAEHAQLDGLGAAGGEGDLVGPGAEDLGDGLAGGVEQHPGLPAAAVQPGRVGPALVQGGGERLPGDRVEGGG